MLKHHLSEFNACSDDSKDNRSVHTQEEFYLELEGGQKPHLKWESRLYHEKVVFKLRDQGSAVSTGAGSC